jgi:hypothetical protein
MDPRAHLDAMEEGTFFTPQGLELRSLDRAASPYTDCAATALTRMG